MVLLNTLPEQFTTLFREAVALHVLGYGRVTCVTVCMRTHCVYEPSGEGVLPHHICMWVRYSTYVCYTHKYINYLHMYEFGEDYIVHHLKNTLWNLDEYA